MFSANCKTLANLKSGHRALFLRGHKSNVRRLASYIKTSADSQLGAFRRPADLFLYRSSEHMRLDSDKPNRKMLNKENITSTNLHVECQISCKKNILIDTCYVQTKYNKQSKSLY